MTRRLAYTEGAMSHSALLAHLLKASGNQILQTFNGLADAHFDTKPLSVAMSPRETAEHLCDCYQAAIDVSEGREHPWGTTKLSAQTPAEAMQEMKALRDAAIAVANEEAAMDYIALHDAYHAGQMVTLRLTVEPDWNAYAIYDDLG